MIQNDCHVRKAGNVKDLVEKASLKYQYHPRIKSYYAVIIIYFLSFQLVLSDEVENEIKTLNTKKACLDGNKLVKFAKMNEKNLFKIHI